MITNKGKKPIYPLQFDLFYKLNKKWIQLNKVIIPENLEFPSDTQNIEIGKTSKNDLQMDKYKLVESDPFFGHIMFGLNDEVFNDFKKSPKCKFKLICTDSVRNKHKIKIPMKKMIPTKGTFLYPKLKMKIENK